MFGRYESFTQKLESLCTHVDTIESRLFLCESGIPDSSSVAADRPLGPISEHMRQFAHFTTRTQRQRKSANCLREPEEVSPQPSASFCDNSGPAPIILKPFDPIPVHTERFERVAPDEFLEYFERTSGLRQRMPVYVNKIQGCTLPYQKRAKRRSVSLAPNPFVQICTLEPGLEPSTTLIKQFRHVVEYRLYHLENTSNFVTESNASFIAKSVRRSSVSALP